MPFNEEKVVRPLFAKGLPMLINVCLTSIHLDLYHLNLSKTAVDVRSVAQILADWNCTLGTFLQLNGLILAFICLLVGIHVAVHGCVFKEVFTVLQLNEVSLRLILGAKDNLCDLIGITNATFARTFVSTQTYASVAAIQGLGTGLVAWQTIAWLVAEHAAALVRALPSAGLNARSAGLSARLRTVAVHAAVLTRSPTGGAITSAGLRAYVRANQETLTGVKTWGMEPALKTPATATATGVATFKLLLTRAPTFRLLCVRFVKARILLAVATLQCDGDLHIAPTEGAWFSTQ